MCVEKKMRTLLSVEMLEKFNHELLNVAWKTLERDCHIRNQWALLVEATLNRLHLSPLVKPHLQVESGCAEGVVKVRRHFNIEAVDDINAPEVRDFCSTLRVNLIRCYLHSRAKSFRNELMQKANAQFKDQPLQTRLKSV